MKLSYKLMPLILVGMAMSALLKITILKNLCSISRRSGGWSWFGCSDKYHSNSPWADTFFFLAPLEGQSIIWIFSILRVSTFYKSMLGSPNRSFCPTLMYFTDQNGSKGGPNENEFWLFSNSEMNVTNSGKSGYKNEIICLVSMFLSRVMVL